MKVFRNLLGAVVGIAVFDLSFQWLYISSIKLAAKIFNPFFLVVLIGMFFALSIACGLTALCTILVSGKYLSFAPKLVSPYILAEVVLVIIAFINLNGFNFAYILIMIQALIYCLSIFFYKPNIEEEAV